VSFVLNTVAIYAYTDAKAPTHGAILKDYEDPSIQHRTATFETLKKVFVLFIGACYQFLLMKEKNRNCYRNTSYRTKQSKLNKRAQKETTQVKMI